MSMNAKMNSGATAARSSMEKTTSAQQRHDENDPDISKPQKTLLRSHSNRGRYYPGTKKPSNNNKPSSNHSTVSHGSVRKVAKISEKCQVSRTMMLRTLLIGCLLTAAAVCACLAYITLRNAEQETAIQTYNSVSISALENARSIIHRKFQASEITAALASWTNPNEEDWPYIFINGYMNITGKIAAVAQSTTQAMMVFIDPSEREAYEDHLQQVYQIEGRPNHTGVQDFGFGIWKPDTNNTYEDGRAPDITGENTWGGEDPRLTVLSLHNVPDSSSLLYNLYSEEDRGIHVDSMNACANENTDPNVSPSCAVFTDMLELKIRPGPAGLLFQPVFPANDPSKFVGFATTSLHWEEALTNIVPDYVNGLTCVISTATATFTYELRRGGAVELIGPGDLHDPRYNQYSKSVILNDIETGSSTSAVYVLTVYPSQAMFATFSTNSPLAVALAFTGVIFLCTLLFFLYDFLMRHEAEQRKLILDMKRRFVRFISHEIRTPLNTVCVGLELLERELRKDTSKAKEQEDNIAGFSPTNDDVDFWHNVTVDVRENAMIAVSILNDMLNYDKLETKSLEIETEEVNVWGLIDQTVHQFQLQAINREVDMKLTFEKPKTLLGSSAGTADSSDRSSNHQVDENADFDPECSQLCVVGDDVRLSQVFRNVISNALKFTPQDGKIGVSVTHVLDGLPQAEDMVIHGHPIARERRRGSILIRVSDSGVGLTKEQLKLLFGEGVQFDANKLQHGGGSGLGLSIAKGIVELHHGTIHAESEGAGHGTTFVIEIPLYEMSLKDEAEEVSQTQAQTETGSSCDGDSVPKKRKILVVEDAMSSRKMLIRLLEREGHTCLAASNGRDAVETIEREMDNSRLEMSMRQDLSTHISSHVPIDTVLMDYEMPFMNGPDAVRAIRRLDYKGTIIGVTGNVLSEDVEYFKESGADEVLAKPISMDRLREYWDRHPMYSRDENTPRT